MQPSGLFAWLTDFRYKDLLTTSILKQNRRQLLRTVYDQFNGVSMNRTLCPVPQADLIALGWAIGSDFSE